MAYKNTKLKATALKLRQKGVSMTVIECQLGIARSTLSAWFKAIDLSHEQKLILENNKLKGLEKARSASITAKRQQKLSKYNKQKTRRLVF